MNVSRAIILHHVKIILRNTYYQKNIYYQRTTVIKLLMKTQISVYVGKVLSIYPVYRDIDKRVRELH